MVLFYCFIPHYNLINFPFNLIGIIIAFLGFLFMGKSRDLFKKHQTTLAIEESSSIITEGVFSKTRNPMYVGMSILILGFAVSSCNLLSLLLPFLFLLLIRIIFIAKEERIMLDTFGDEYLEYKKKARRWL